MPYSPHLFFSKTDIPIFRERIKNSPFKETWGGILKRADGLCDKDGPWYMGPDDMDAPNRVQDNPKHPSRKSGICAGRLAQVVEALGFAWHMTGSHHYARHGIGLLTATARRCPVTETWIANVYRVGRLEILTLMAFCDRIFFLLDPFCHKAPQHSLQKKPIPGHL